MVTHRVMTVLCFYGYVVKTLLALRIVQHDVQFGRGLHFSGSQSTIVKHCAFASLTTAQIRVQQLTLLVVVELILMLQRHSNFGVRNTERLWFAEVGRLQLKGLFVRVRSLGMS